MLSLATLTRPTGLYLPIALLAGYILIAFVQKNEIRIRVYTILVLLISCYFLPGLWMLRNYQTFGIFTLSGNENIVMVYYTGGGAWETHFNCSLEQAQKRIQEEYNLPPAYVCHNTNAFDIPPEVIDAQLRAHKRQVLLKYPLSLIKSGMIGVPKSLLAHETGAFAILTGLSWRSDKKLENSYPPLIFFLWSLLFQVCLIILALFGFVKMLFHRNCYPLLLLSGCCIAYFILTMSLSGIDCCGRYRIPAMPFFYLFAAMCFWSNQLNSSNLGNQNTPEHLAS